MSTIKETRFTIRGRYRADNLTIFRAKKENFITSGEKYLSTTKRFCNKHMHFCVIIIKTFPSV